MHGEAFEWVQRHATTEPVTVLEIGSRDVNGNIRALFPGATRYVGVDISPGTGVDLVADAATLCLDEMFDVVVSTEVLEHTKHWRAIVARMIEHLAPGGRLIITAAGPGRSPHSMSGGASPAFEWYENIEPADLAAALADLPGVHVDQLGADVRAYGVR